MDVILYSDGSSRGNPGPGGFGTILSYVDKTGHEHVLELTKGYRRTTNNRMELMGVISGFEALTKPCNVTVISDSKYVVDAFNQKWINSWIESNWKRKTGPVLNVDLWKRLLIAMEPHSFKFVWVKGHAGHPENERCDELATQSADGDNLLIDEGFIE